MFWRKKVQIFHFPHSQRNSFTAKFKLCGSLYGRKWSPSRNKSFARVAEKEQSEPDFERLISALASLKISLIRIVFPVAQALPTVFALCKQKSALSKFFDPQRAELRADFGAEDVGMLYAFRRRQAERCRNYAFSGEFGLLFFGYAFCDKLGVFPLYHVVSACDNESRRTYFRKLRRRNVRFRHHYIKHC